MGFNLRYKVYLDWTVPKSPVLAWDNDTDADWVEVFPDVEEPKKAPFNKEMFSRYSWGDVTFKNNPNLTGDAAETYNLIADAAIDQEIRIKVILSTDLVRPDTSTTIRGYFGTNDCEFDEDQGSIKVIPTILDQYTDLVENWETEVPIFGETVLKKAFWGISKSLPLVDLNPKHSLPCDLLTSETDDAVSVIDIYDMGVNGSILRGAIETYSISMFIYIDAVLGPSLFTFFVEVYDNDDQLYEFHNLATVDGGNILETYNANLDVPKGYYIKVMAYPFGASTITYNNILISASISVPSFPTTDVNVNLQNSWLKTKEIWIDTAMGTTNSILKSEYDSEIPTLAAYFETSGEPKDTILDQNSFAPYSTKASIDSSIIQELGTETIPIQGLYMGVGNDIGGILEPYGFEISEVEVYSKFWWSGWFNSVHKAKTYALCKFSRFEQYVTIGETPSGGWTDTGLDLDGKRLWVKKPFDGSITEWELGDIDSSGGTNASIEWDVKLKSTKTYPSSEDSVTLQTRDFKEIVKTVFNGTFLSLVNDDINSSFFWNDSDPNITVDEGKNYFTGDTNWLNNIAVAHTYQLQETNNDSEDSILKMSFKDLMADMKAEWNNQIFWWVSTDGVLHIEHLKYIDIAKQTLDLTVVDESPYLNNIKLLDEISSWKYDKSEMFSLVNFQIANSGYKDFTDNNITYDKIVSNKRNEDIRNTISTRKITTDIRYCIENPSDLENGMILLNHDAEYNTIVAHVPISNVSFENGNLALSNILNRYKYEGIFFSGKINGVSVDFDVTTRTKVGKEITLKGIYDYEYFKSKIGVGRIETMTHDLKMEHTVITLRYRFGSGTISDTFVLMVSEVGDYVGAENVQFDFG